MQRAFISAQHSSPPKPPGHESMPGRNAFDRSSSAVQNNVRSWYSAPFCVLTPDVGIIHLLSYYVNRKIIFSSYPGKANYKIPPWGRSLTRPPSDSPRAPKRRVKTRPYSGWCGKQQFDLLDSPANVGYNRGKRKRTD